ncbi:MAG: hypothetical protein LBC79_08935 [Deltaproteobacteria bacterium]|jgi:hypothetical protein|nr:hypothetical protein [Deltaproteobacteria bacterium]
MPACPSPGRTFPLRGLRLFLPALALCCGAYLPGATDAHAGSQDNAQQENTTRGEKLAPELEATLTALIAAVPAGKSLPAEAELAALARFMMSPAVTPSDVRIAKREHGEGALLRQTFRSPFAKLVRYCFDPRIPTEVLYPMVLRRGHWLPDSRLVKENIPLWSELDTQTMRVLRGTEYEEITPDSFSGCYYNYKLLRLVVLLQVDGKPALLSVARQDGPSSVGRKAAIVGEDSDWNYVYTRAVGSNLPLASWAETYMYDSVTVSLMYPNGEGGGLAFFKWVKAGWANMNMVKSKHIRAGGERFLFSMRQVLDARNLPEPEAISAHRDELAALDDAALHAAFEPHAAALASGAQNNSILSKPDFQAVLKDGAYARQLGRRELISELMKLYMKERLGMRDPAPTP